MVPTSLSTTEVKVEDKNIVLGDTSTPTDTTANGGGITLKGADYTIVWLDVPIPGRSIKHQRHQW